MGDLPYPFSATDEAPFYTVALGNGEYVWVTLAGNYRDMRRIANLWRKIAVDLYCDLHPHRTRAECEAEVHRWQRDLPDGD
jgi:hypothetical protein